MLADENKYRKRSQSNCEKKLIKKFFSATERRDEKISARRCLRQPFNFLINLI